MSAMVIMNVTVTQSRSIIIMILFNAMVIMDVLKPRLQPNMCTVMDQSVAVTLLSWLRIFCVPMALTVFIWVKYILLKYI